jgi:xylulokinase
VILTVDLGTSVTKVALWDDDGLVAMARSALDTSVGPGGIAEQDPSSWWASVAEACREVAREVKGAGAIEALGFSAARQSFVCVDDELHPLGTGILWSDRRAAREAAELCDALGGREQVLRRTGTYLEAGSVAAKVAWLVRNEPDRMKVARWLLSPRDLVIARMTGVVVTDTTLASATGLYDEQGCVVPELAELVDRQAGAQIASFGLVRVLPEARPPSTIVGSLLRDAAVDLGLVAGLPVVVGAGDRPCETLGSGASRSRPMASWGTTANVSVPWPRRHERPPGGMIATRAATDHPGWLLEGGVSAAGSLLEWLARMFGTDVARLVDAARQSPPGARGVLVMPWLGGARAPWWCADAGVSVIGLRNEHSPADIARAAIEAVAFDLARCLDASYEDCASAPGREELTRPRSLALGGAGSRSDLWPAVLGAVTGLSATRRRSGEAASAGAALIVAKAVGKSIDLEVMDPVVDELVPDRDAVASYVQVRPAADAVAASMIEFAGCRAQSRIRGTDADRAVDRPSV